MIPAWLISELEQSKKEEIELKIFLDDENIYVDPKEENAHNSSIIIETE